MMFDLEVKNVVAAMKHEAKLIRGSNGLLTGHSRQDQLKPHISKAYRCKLQKLNHIWH